MLVAEDITSRFLNVVSLLNASIPLIAIKMQLIKVGSQHTLIFTKVLDELARWDDEPPTEAVPADRTFWESAGKREKQAVVFADEFLAMAQKLDPSLSLNYTRYYIALMKDRQPFNFFSIEPRSTGIQLNLRLTPCEDNDSKIEAADFSKTLEHAYGFYRIHVSKADLAQKREQLEELIGLAYREWTEAH